MASSSSNSGSKLLLMHPLPCPWFPFSTRPTLHTSFRRLPPCNHSRKGSDGSALFSRTGTPLSDLRCAARPEPNSTQPLLLFLSKIPMTTNSTPPKSHSPHSFAKQPATTSLRGPLPYDDSIIPLVLLCFVSSCPFGMRLGNPVPLGRAVAVTLSPLLGLSYNDGG